MIKNKTYIDRVLEHEGGYVNDPFDRGGETYRGIARNHNPTWGGWDIIDQLKETHADMFPAILEQDSRLQSKVYQLYNRKYWIDNLGEALAFQVFDFGVNSGVTRAKKYLQITLGVVADGVIGPKTLAALDEVEDIYTFILEYNNNRMRYLSKLKQFNRYGAGWTKRVMQNNQFAKEDC